MADNSRSAGAEGFDPPEEKSWGEPEEVVLPSSGLRVKLCRPRKEYWRTRFEQYPPAIKEKIEFLGRSAEPGHFSQEEREFISSEGQAFTAAAIFGSVGAVAAVAGAAIPGAKQASAGETATREFRPEGVKEQTAGGGTAAAISQAEAQRAAEIEIAAKWVRGEASLKEVRAVAEGSAAAGQSAAAPSGGQGGVTLNVHVHGSVYGSGGMAELADHLSDAVQRLDVNLVARRALMPPYAAR